MIILIHELENGWAAACAIISLICGYLFITFTGSHAQNYENIKSQAQDVRSQYQSSSKTSEDWEWVVDQYTYINQLVEKADDNNDVYAWIDITYLTGYRPSPEEYTVIITDDKIEFPIDYNWLPLRKPAEQP